MTRLWRLAGGLLAIVLVMYFLWFCFKNLNLELLGTTLRSPANLAALGFSTACYMSIYPLTGWAWRQLLVRQGEDRPTLQLSQWVGLTQLAKYIPGNIAQHAGRAAISLRHGMRFHTFLTSTAQEMLLALAASIIIGSTALALSGVWTTYPQLQWLLYLLIAGSSAGILLFCIDLPTSRIPPTANWRWKLMRLIGGLPGAPTTLKALTAYSTNYLLIGLGIWTLAKAIGAADDISYPLAVAAFSLSWALGFLAPGSPAGLGAREGIMLLILQPATPAEQAALLVLLARLSSMCGDLLTFFVAVAFNASAVNQRPDSP